VPEIVVKSAAGASAQVAAGTTAGEALKALDAVRGMVVVARVDGRLVDLDAEVDDGATVEAVLAASDEGRAVLRHSTAHVLAQAVTDLYPGTRLADGPPIPDGFFYAFDAERPFRPDDLPAIEQRMKAIVKERQAFRRRDVAVADALAELGDELYKRAFVERAQSGGAVDDPTVPSPDDGRVSFYDNVRLDPDRPDEVVWTDLCRGPHVPHTGFLQAFELERVAGAYWRGDESGPVLSRIYGTAWEDRKALAAYRERIHQARLRDHRVLGRDLDLFSFPDELGTGLAVWHPKGAIVRQEMEDYIRAEVRRRGYQPVYTPHLANGHLFETSGHLSFYAEGMYPPMALDPGSGGAGIDYYPKPMNCPFHVLIYKSRQRSYRELPLRLAELGTVYRYERSGVVHGLLRARGFTQDDSHIFCTADQVVDEVLGCLEFALDVYRAYGFVEGPSRVALSTRPPKAETVGTDEEWAHAEDALRQALDRSGLDYVVDEGEGAFYGPKIDLQVTDAIGRSWQLTTVQVDFNHPQRFDLEYTAADGSAQRPYMVHRALYGSLDRFFGILLEHYAGAFPLWLAPVQAVVVPIADRHLDYAATVADRFRARGLRVDVDGSDDTMGAKIRKHQLAKVPYQLIVGDAEEESGQVALRPRVGDQRKGLALDAVVEELADEVARRAVGEPA
jgi:threonyl-tRNA synthetase